MSSKYKRQEDERTHFMTFAVIGWEGFFYKESYKDIYYEEPKFLYRVERINYNSLSY